jgi:hypothetical protein
MRTLLVAITFLTIPASAPAAVGEWPEFMKQQFIESNCAPSLEAEGYGASAVQDFCSCFADQIEANFSPFEYEDILAAQPNASGSSADQRLYAALITCRPQQ